MFVEVVEWQTHNPKEVAPQGVRVRLSPSTVVRKPKVYNQRNKTLSGRPPPDAVYVGRPSSYGNPFPLKEEKEQVQVIEQYENWLNSQPTLIADIKANLRGKDLVCWCSPKLCHVDLLRIANE